MRVLSTPCLKNILKIGFILSSFFDYPLRIFFITSAVFAILACVGLLLDFSTFVHFHQFIFLQSFLGAAFAGFLLTALPLWCKIESPLRFLSISLFVLLCLAFFMQWWLNLGQMIMAVFWFILLIFCGVYLWRSKNTRNLSLLFVLLGIFALCVGKIFINNVNLDYAYIHLCVLAILIVSFRVSLVLGNDALKDENLSFVPNVVLKNISSFLLFVLIIATLWDKSANLNGFFALSVGFSLFSRLANWHYGVFFKTHYTFILYLLFLATSLVYMGLGLVYLCEIAPLSFVLHLLNLLVLLTFVLFVFNTVSLKHTQNQIFNFTFGTKSSFLALFVAGFSRGILALIIGFECFYIDIPALLVCFAFGYFIYRFIPIYTHNDFKGE